jgi:hypothetical protein
MLIVQPAGTGRIIGSMGAYSQRQNSPDIVRKKKMPHQSLGKIRAFWPFLQLQSAKFRCNFNMKWKIGPRSRISQVGVPFHCLFRKKMEKNDQKSLCDKNPSSHHFEYENEARSTLKRILLPSLFYYVFFNLTAPFHLANELILYLQLIIGFPVKQDHGLCRKCTLHSALRRSGLDLGGVSH